MTSLLVRQNEPISKRPLLPNICVPDERDLRFASTGSKAGIFDLILNPAVSGKRFETASNDCNIYRLEGCPSGLRRRS